MKIQLNVKGMHCKSCEVLIQDALEEVGAKATVDSKAGKAVVDYDGKKLSIEKIKQIIKREGYTVE
ncbi:heavy-metal-associated domain-containing protein [Candidatus Woesearchaeota archaeon]|nr:heavy-metal-associated domain-containing protein [Candidatus Woesearchaeota archaeon]